eukprot:CAMPEP_0196802122 /NCGR_PEP_ID=MMETSP1362-20130617/1811_1 /TAXON_ID=163516 /ORGANISM="Leptocylindrus danicus, Strain CCMP1856" /LENGTH=227 /DNA_ID=CAMNT_0042173337 /DNA_START=36 /DNA_END=719 /DNA_ORIENTATION=+
MLKALIALTSLVVAPASAFTFPSKHAFTSRSALKMAADDVEVAFPDLDGKEVRVGIIKTRWNKEHVDNIVSGAKEALAACNVTEDNIFETEVPGAYELPFAAKLLALSGTVDAIICTGVLIKGGTMHFEYICEAVSSGIMSVGLQTNVPVVFGVLTCLDEQQVIQRSTGANNHGDGWGKTAVEMALLRRESLGVKSRMSSLGFKADEEELSNGEKGKKLTKSAPGFF